MVTELENVLLEGNLRMKFEEAWADTAKQNQFLKIIAFLALIGGLLVSFVLGKSHLSHHLSSNENVTLESLKARISHQMIARLKLF